MKKIFFLSFFVFLISVWQTYACEYKSQSDRCTAAQNPNTTRSIQDFVCSFNPDPQYRLVQIILDMEFKKIDKKVMKFLQDLEKDKDKFFWKNATKIKIDPLVDALDFVEYKLNFIDWEFAREYQELCNKTIRDKVINCIGKDEWVKATNAILVLKSINTPSVCQEIYKNKLEIYESIAINVLKLNKLSIRKDNKKTYQQENRWNYEKLIDYININVWYMERIWKKWPSKTKYPHK